MNKAYDELCRHWRRLHHFGHLQSIASWDQAAMMPPKEGQRRLPGIFGPKIIGENTFGNDFSEENMIRVFERHNEEVKRTIPAGRLLVFEAKDGWEPLCAFLGVKVPSDPYPSMNSTEDFQAMVKAASAGQPAKPH